MEQVLLSLCATLTGKWSVELSEARCYITYSSVLLLPQGKTFFLNCAAQRSSTHLRYSICPSLFLSVFFLLLFPLYRSKFMLSSGVVGLQTHTAQFGFNLIPPGPPNSISDP